MYVHVLINTDVQYALINTAYRWADLDYKNIHICNRVSRSARY